MSQFPNTAPKLDNRRDIFDDYTGPGPDGKYPCDAGESPCGCSKCAAKLLHDHSNTESHTMTTANPSSFSWATPCPDVWEIPHPNVWEEAKIQEIAARVFKFGNEYQWRARLRDPNASYQLTDDWCKLQTADSLHEAQAACERFMLAQLPPLPSDPFDAYKHLNGGTYREPKKGEEYINANSIDPKVHPEGIKPFAMRYEGIGLDAEIPTKCRWIIIQV